LLRFYARIQLDSAMILAASSATERLADQQGEVNAGRALQAFFCRAASIACLSAS
jgi:hypothetical protein